jgi:roadblock/LC7 domain-containing protein
MADLGKLMALPGALAAFEFSDRGELLAHKINEGCELNEKVLDLLCHVCVANMSIATMQARGWESMTGAEGFYPIEGFTLIGLEWSAVTSGNFGVVLPNNEADYQAAYDALGQ